MARKMSFKEQKYNEIIDDLRAKNARLERELSDGRTDYNSARRMVTVLRGTPFKDSIDTLNLLADALSVPISIVNALRTAAIRLTVAAESATMFPGIDDSEYLMSEDRYNTVIRGL